MVPRNNNTTNSTNINIKNHKTKKIPRQEQSSILSQCSRIHTDENKAQSCQRSRRHADKNKSPVVSMPTYTHGQKQSPIASLQQWWSLYIAGMYAPGGNIRTIAGQPALLRGGVVTRTKYC